MAQKLGLGGHGQENYNPKNGRYVATALSKAIDEAKARPNSDLRPLKYQDKMSQEEIDSHKLDQFVYSPFFEKNGFATLNQIIQKYDKNGGIFDFFKFFPKEVAEKFDLDGADYFIMYKGKEFAVDLKTVIPNKSGVNEVLKLPLISFDGKIGTHVDGWFVKNPIQYNKQTHKYEKKVITDFWVFQAIASDMTNINTTMVKKNAFKKWIIDDFFDGKLNHMLYFNQFKAIANNAEQLENKPETIGKKGKFKLSYNKEGKISQIYETVFGKCGVPMNVVCSIHYNENKEPTYSVQLQPPLEIFNYFGESANLDENEETVLNSLFGIQ